MPEGQPSLPFRESSRLETQPQARHTADASDRDERFSASDRHFFYSLDAASPRPSTPNLQLRTGRKRGNVRLPELRFRIVRKSFTCPFSSRGEVS